MSGSWGPTNMKENEFLFMVEINVSRARVSRFIQRRNSSRFQRHTRGPCLFPGILYSMPEDVWNAIRTHAATIEWNLQYWPRHEAKKQNRTHRPDFYFVKYILLRTYFGATKNAKNPECAREALKISFDC